MRKPKRITPANHIVSARCKEICERTTRRIDHGAKQIRKKLDEAKTLAEIAGIGVKTYMKLNKKQKKVIKRYVRRQVKKEFAKCWLVVVRNPAMTLKESKRRAEAGTTGIRSVQLANPPKATPLKPAAVNEGLEPIRKVVKIRKKKDE